jgi:chemotaxis protein CheX
MLMMEATEINNDVLDAVGELTNMVAGAAKAELEEFQLQVSLPNVVTGDAHEIHFPSNVTPLSISFETDWGPLALEVGLAPVPEFAGA